ncbi:CBN-ADD-1 protein [Caenorhabditis brenneri]|uniref:CBN-ADD-1 protein n=1 Tax=Caenorhabditis brenneri TaxID=135651 RepID=G0M8B9_CAEBE|nr:CBN-ADD-1 protein [Caenorhabditis brenneri]
MYGQKSRERERPYLRDPDDPEYIKELQRPAVIKEDLSEMERRKRVQQILESKSFCHELEEVIRQECDTARTDPDHLQVLQKLADLTVPQGNMSFGNLHTYGVNTIAIADLQGNENYSKTERMQRNKLSCLFRLADLFQWSQGIHNEISYRTNDEDNTFLMNPYGLLYHEITAATIVKIDENGKILDCGALKAGVNQPAFLLHSAIYKARPMVRCVLHMHTAIVAAVASMKFGLLPLCQEAMVIGPVGYHDYQDIGDDDIPFDELLASLGDKNVLFLRNQGFLVVGDTIEHATFLANNTVIACETQVRAARAGLDNLIIPDEKAIQRAYRNSRNTNSLKRNGTVDWRVGELEWESWMRVLDHANFRTGHVYRQPQLRPKSAMSTSMVNNNDVALPPTTSAYGKIDETNLESVSAHRLAMLRKEQERVRWLNSPNAYQKVEFLEYGADNPKKITKWVSDGNGPSASGTPVKINSVHQFSPASSNPKEFKEKQKAIKENNRLGTLNAGPQSQILDGITYEDISLLITRPDDEVGPSSAADRAKLIGSASKGIIDRQYQHHAQVYHQIYQPNPFSMETAEGLRRYVESVKEKNARRPPPDSARSAMSYSQYDDVEADTVSLMQGVREHRLSQAALSASDDGLNAGISPVQNNVQTSEESVNTSYMSQSVVFDCDHSFPVSISPALIEKPNEKPCLEAQGTSEGTTTSRSCTTASEEESRVKDEKKKKKKGLLSFIRRKEK